MIVARLAFLVGCASALGACVQVPDARFRCASDADCPIGTRCVDGDGASASRFFQRCTFPTCF